MCRSMKSLIILLTSVVVTGEILSAQEKTHVEIAGFSVGKKDPESQFGQGLSMTKQPGLETDIFFRLPGRTILSIDEKQSKITLTTNEGNQLPLEEFFDGFFQMTVNDNPSEGTITLRCAELPAKSTSNFLIDGKFVLITGADLKTVDVDLKLVEGTKIKFGPAQLSVNQIGPAFGDPFKQSFELSGPQPLDTIQTVEFLDDKGEVIESSDSGSGSSGFGENMTYSKSWQIATEAKTLKARVSYFSKTEPVNLPCKLTFGLGL